MKKTNKGFTLVELIIVIAVIGVLAAILIPVFANVVEKANRQSALSDAKNMVTELNAELIDAANVEGLTDTVLFVKKGGKVYVFGYQAADGKLVNYHGEGYEFNGATEADFTTLVNNTILPEISGNAEILTNGINAADELGRAAAALAVTDVNLHNVIAQLGFNPAEVAFAWGYNIQNTFSDAEAQTVYQATVNGVAYSTFEEAFSAAKNTSYELKLLKDVTAAETIMASYDCEYVPDSWGMGFMQPTVPFTGFSPMTINLNGHTLSFAPNTINGIFVSGEGYDVANNDWSTVQCAASELTIKNGTIDLSNCTGENESYEIYGIATSGTLILDNVDVIDTSAALDYAIGVSGDTGVLSMNSSTLVTSSVIGIEAGTSATVNLTGSTIHNTNTAGSADAISAVYNDGSHVTISGSEIISDKGCGVVMFTQNASSNTDTTLTVTSGSITAAYFGISNNGNNSYNTTTTISGGSVTSTGATGIYHPGMGTLTINENTSTTYIEGKDCGIEVRSGSLTMTAGTVKCLDNTLWCKKNANGTTTKGAAIAVVQHTTKKAITLNITGGTITGGEVGIFQGDPHANGNTALKRITITVAEGVTITPADQIRIMKYSYLNGQGKLHIASTFTVLDNTGFSYTT